MTTKTTLSEAASALARSSQFSHADIAAAVETLRTSPDTLDFTPWTDGQLIEGLPTLAEIATRLGCALESAAGLMRIATQKERSAEVYGVAVALSGRRCS